MSDTEVLEPWFPIEERLKDDTQGSERDRLIAQLQQQAVSVKRKLDAGVPQREFAQLDSVHKALEAAIPLIALIWSRYHSAR